MTLYLLSFTLSLVSRVMPWIVLFLVSAIWGGAFAAIKYLLDYINPTGLLIMRMLPTALIAILLLLVFYRKSAVTLFLKYWPVFAVISIIWLFGYHYVLNIGETVLPAAAAGLIIGTYPIITIFLAAIFLNEKLTPARTIGGLIAFGGTASLLLFGASHEAVELDIEPSKWVLFGLLTMLAPVSAAVHTVIAKPYLTGENPDRVKIDPILLNLLYMAPSMVLLVPIMVISPPVNHIDFNTGFWLALGFLVVFCTLIAYFGWLWAVRRFGAGMASISTYSIPVFSLIYARIWLGEPIGAGTVIGATGIIIGVLVASVGSGVGNSDKKNTGNKKLATRTS